MPVRKESDDKDGQALCAHARVSPASISLFSAGAKVPPLFKNNLNFASDKPDQWRAWARQWRGCKLGFVHSEERD